MDRLVPRCPRCGTELGLPEDRVYGVPGEVLCCQFCRDDYMTDFFAGRVMPASVLAEMGGWSRGT